MPPTRRPLNAPLLTLAGLTVAAAVLRFATLDVQSLWLDEGATVILMRKGFGDMLSSLPSSESAPPLYYVLAWIWSRVFGIDAIGLRSLSALAGTALVPVAYLAARRASERAGLWCAALAAVSPLTFYYSQEARAYALLVLLAGIAFVLWQRAQEHPTSDRLWAWSAVSCLALLTHYFALFLIVPQALALLNRIGLRRVLPYLAPIGVVGAALLPLAVRQRADGKSDWIEATSLASRIGQVPKQYLVGIDGPAEILTAVVTLACVAAALVLLVRRGDARERRVAGWAGGVTLVALGLPLVFSVTKVADVFNGRNVVEVWLPAATVVGVALGTARAARAGAVLGVALCAVSLAVVVGVLTDPGVQRDDWRGIAETVGDHPPAGGRLIVGPPKQGGPLSVYDLRTRAVLKPRVLRTTEVDAVTLRVRRTAKSSLPPPAPLRAPRGFRPAGVKRTDAYLVARYVAPRPTAVSTRELLAALGQPGSEVAVQPARG